MAVFPDEEGALALAVRGGFDQQANLQGVAEAYPEGRQIVTVQIKTVTVMCSVEPDHRKAARPASSGKSQVQALPFRCGQREGRSPEVFASQRLEILNGDH